MSNNNSFYSQLEGFRGVAILLVMISHFIIVPYFPALNFLKFGFLGVNMFFVLSGFLITELLLKAIYSEKRNKKILQNFYIRRTLRIFPIYYLSIILLYAFNVGNTRDVVWYTATYTYNLANVWNGINSEAVTHFWSLCVEEQFYLFWPVLLIVANRKYAIHLIIVMIAVGVLSRFLYIGMQLNNYQHFIWSTMACFDCLGFGALLAWLKLNKSKWLQRILKLYFIPLALITVFYIISKVTGSEDGNLLFGGFGRLIIGIAGFFLVGIGALNFTTWCGQVMKRGGMRFIGRISYGLYLYHWILFFLLADRVKSWLQLNLTTDIYLLDKLKYHSYIFVFVILSLISIAVAFLSFELIEKPFLKLKEKLSSS